MDKVKKISFIQSCIGEECYKNFKFYAFIYVPIASVVLFTIIVLTHFKHNIELSNILNAITGTTVLFIVYIFGVVFLLDYQVDIVLKEDAYGKEKTRNSYPLSYYYTIFWDIILVILAICAIHYSDLYRKHYTFECESFYVNENKGIYHIDNNCEEFEYTTRMKGYEIIENGYSICGLCKEWAIEMEYINTDELRY